MLCPSQACPLSLGAPMALPILAQELEMGGGGSLWIHSPWAQEQSLMAPCLPVPEFLFLLCRYWQINSSFLLWLLHSGKKINVQPDWRQESWAVETHGFVGRSALSIATSCPSARARTLSVLPRLWLPYFSSISELDLKAFLLDENNLTPKKMEMIRKTSASASRTQAPAVASLVPTDMPRKSVVSVAVWNSVAGK